jgi:hypothetical protein
MPQSDALDTGIECRLAYICLDLFGEKDVGVMGTSRIGAELVDGHIGVQKPGSIGHGCGRYGIGCKTSAASTSGGRLPIVFLQYFDKREVDVGGPERSSSNYINSINYSFMCDSPWSCRQLPFGQLQASVEGSYAVPQLSLLGMKSGKLPVQSLVQPGHYRNGIVFEGGVCSRHGRYSIGRMIKVVLLSRLGSTCLFVSTATRIDLRTCGHA